MDGANRESRGNGYYEYEHGRFDAALVYAGEMIARTDGDVILGFDRAHKDAITEWADEYGYDVEWRDK